MVWYIAHCPGSVESLDNEINMHNICRQSRFLLQAKRTFMASAMEENFTIGVTGSMDYFLTMRHGDRYGECVRNWNKCFVKGV